MGDGKKSGNKGDKTDGRRGLRTYQPISSGGKLRPPQGGTGTTAKPSGGASGGSGSGGSGSSGKGAGDS